MVLAGSLSVLTLAVTATVIESTPITTSYTAPTESGSESGPSLRAVLVQLVDAVLSMLGVETDSAVGAGGVGSSIDVLVAAIAVLWPIAVPVIGIGALVAIGLLAFRQLPESVRRSLLSRPHRTPPERASRSDVTDRTWPPVEPDCEVAKTWVAMTEQLDVDRPHARTPTEWADAAVTAGFDEEAVTTLTKQFSERQYSNGPEPTEWQHDSPERDGVDEAGDTE